MESFGIEVIVLILVAVWYLGRSINSILEGSGIVAEKEFNLFQQKQDLRIHKEKQKLYKTVQKSVDDKFYSDSEWDKIFNPDRDND